MTHCRLCRLVCSSRMSVESDTLSSVVSMMMMARASERTRRLPHLRRGLSVRSAARAVTAAQVSSTALAAHALCTVKYLAMHDVAVVGAGLAGLQCARLLAARGLRVVLIDRKETLAAPIHTTGIFVRKTWEDFPLPDEQLGTPIRDVHLYSPSLRSLHLRADHDEFRVGRMEWIYLHLLEQCSRAGVQWLPSSRLIGCHDTTLTLQRGSRTETLTARYIVGADGARSSVARALGLDRNRELLVGLEDIVETTPRPAALHCFLDPRLAPGYIGWIVNERGAAHIGLAGYGDSFDPSRALDSLRHLLRHVT